MIVASHAKNFQLRQQLTYIAARLLLADPTLGAERARRKAAQQLGGVDVRYWPSAAEVLAILAQEQRLFCPQQPQVLHTLRTQALAAMRHFARFQPRLVGSVLAGNADNNSRVSLHLFADTTEEVILAMLDANIPCQQRERTVRYANGERHCHLVLYFIAGTNEFELLILPSQAQRNPPLNLTTERPERGADIEQLQRLLVGTNPE